MGDEADFLSTARFSVPSILFSYITIPTYVSMLIYFTIKIVLKDLHKSLHYIVKPR